MLYEKRTLILAAITITALCCVTLALVWLNFFDPIDSDSAIDPSIKTRPSGPIDKPSSKSKTPQLKIKIPTEPPKQPKTTVQTVTVARGDTLMELLVRNDISRADAANIIKKLSPVFDMSRLKIGQTFKLTFSINSNGKSSKETLSEISFRPNFDQNIIVRSAENRGFEVKVTDRPLKQVEVFAEGVIKSNLYETAVEVGLPPNILARLVRMFSFDVDFQRDIQPGDSFALLYEHLFDSTGIPVHSDNIIWASMTLSGKLLEYAFFTPSNGIPDYYDRNGKSVKKTLMRTPIDGARLSSRYGKRRHPILGFNKMHRGVDFAAAKGVPIMAAGDGVIESIGRKGAYGKYIRIRHNATYKTAYAHMSKFRRGLQRGARVKQGSIIGYVGSTGRSTGPHLHYEVLVHGRQTNPMSVRIPAGDKLKGKDLQRFLAEIHKIEERIAAADQLKVNH